MEWQLYQNLPAYVVCPMDGEGHSWTLHRNYLLPISNNLEQAEDEISVVGVEPIDKPSPVSTAGNRLPAKGLTESQPGGPSNSPPKQHKLVNPELTRSITPDLVYGGSQAGLDQPSPLRQDACTTRNQLPWRY